MQISNSRNIIINRTDHGIKQKNKPNNLIKLANHTNELSILIRAWPAKTLANNRIAKLKIRTKYDVNSNKIKNHDINNGVPVGKKIFTNLSLCSDNEIVFSPINAI